jgi:hypothetical protein
MDETENKVNTDCVIEFNEHFKMPIYFNDQKVSLKENIITDLELINTIDSSSNSIYSYVFDILYFRDYRLLSFQWSYVRRQ